MNTANFDINDALKHYMSDPFSVPTPEVDGALLDCENDPESLTSATISPVLNQLVAGVAGGPDAITRSAHLDSLQFLLKCALIFLPRRFPRSRENRALTCPNHLDTRPFYPRIR